LKTGPASADLVFFIFMCLLAIFRNYLKFYLEIAPHITDNIVEKRNNYRRFVIMMNYSNFNTGKVYSMLFIADYTKATPAWRKYVDTLINNLLDKPPSAEWVKYENLPKITVSIVDKAETRQQAFDKLSTVKYDVVFVDTSVDNQPNGPGIIGRYHQFQPTSMYIPLLAPAQIKGAVKKDGSICDGAGITRLYEKGFYNGVVKKDLNLAKLIEMILSGGRSKEDAFMIYGLDYGQAKLEEDVHIASDAGKVEDMSAQTEVKAVPDDMSILLEAAQLFPEFSLNEVKIFVEDANSNLEKLQVVSSMFHTKTNLVNPYEWVRDTIGRKPVEPLPSTSLGETGVVKEDSMVEQTFSEEKIDASLSSNDVDNNSVETENTSTKPLNRKQRRQLRRQQELEAKGISVDSAESGSGKESQQVSHGQDTVQSSSSVQQPPSNPVVQDPYLQELEQMQVSGALQERGSFNNGLVRTGVIHGTITYAKGTMAIVELPVDMETLGLRLPDIYNAPVVIPYSKFGMGDIKKDI